MKLATTIPKGKFPKIKKMKIAPSNKEKKLENKKEDIFSEIKIHLQRIWTIIPLYIKIMSFSSIILYILNLFFKSISFYLSNIPLYTIYHYQFWRILTSFLITTNIFNIILGLIFWIREGSSMEARLGTLKYILIFLINNILIQILYSLIILLISLIIRNKQFMEKKIINKDETIYQIKNCGLWPNIMCELTLLCISNPYTQVNFLFIPYNFSAKYYPFLIFIVFCLVNNYNYNNDIEVFVGVLFALIYHNFLKNYLNIPDRIIKKIEKKICCKCITDATGFVKIGQIDSSFALERSNSRMDIKVLKLNKINRKKIKNSNDDTERDVKISSEYSNRNDTSMASIIIPSKSIFERPIQSNATNP